jgi:hypothetical protein
MRAVLVLLLVAACGGSSRAPAWPKERVVDVEEEGGESIAPRPSTAALAEEDDDDEIEVDLVIPEVKAEPAKKDDKKPETPTGVTPVGTTPEEILTTEEIVIEIED